MKARLLINGYTVSEHIEIRRSYEYQIRKEMNNIENMLNHLKKHKRLYFKLVMIVAMMLMSGYINPVHAATLINVNEAINKIDTLGNQLLRLMQSIAYWTMIVMTGKECLTEAINGNKHGVGNALVKGVMVMAVIYFLPDLFDMMKSLVSE
ncbi:MAG: hypothetical protein ACRCX2_35755 [Paraclostridium sp.]